MSPSVGCQQTKQEAQLSQRDRAMLRVIAYFARSLSLLKLVPFESLGTVSCLPSIVTMALSCTISEKERDIGRKSRFFIPPWIRRPH